MSKERRDPPAERRSPLASEALLEALRDLVPGYEPLDQELELPGGAGGARAEAVGVDGGGRLVLVLVIAGDEDRDTLAVLDALAWAGGNAAALASHLGSPRVRPALPPLAVLLSEAFSPRFVARLGPLVDQRVELYELRTVTSARGETRWLVPVGAARGSGAPAGAAGPEEIDPGAFLEGIPAAARAQALAFSAKLARLDTEVEAGATRRELRWRLRGATLARLRVQAGVPVALAAPVFAPRPLVDAASVELAVEEVLGHYVRILEGQIAAGGDGGPSGSEGSDTERHAFDRQGSERPGPERTGARGTALLPEGLPSLTPEEIEAFRL